MVVKSPISEAVDQIVSMGIHPLLKERGFKKRGRTFHKRVGDLYHVVRVQASRYNEFDAGQFTINLGIASPEIAATWLHGSGFKNPASQGNLLLFTRIGALLPRQKDKWWTIDADTDAPRLAQQVGDALASYGLEFFENAAFQSTETLLQALERDDLPVRLFGAPTIREEVHALLLHRAGRVSEAETVLANLLRGKEDRRGLKRYVNRIRALGARLGFSL